ncbi:MAG: Nramp family divalent metal transporter, partial [candidate division NC10 bacterium]|nr:Nramp family divalent metal transporter [candidate division NC10 bacterium]
TGEGMIDMIGRIPPGKWGVWVVGIAELLAGAVSIGALITAGTVFANALVPFISPVLWGWILSIIIIYLIWSGSVDRLKVIMTVLVALMVIGVMYTGYRLIPGLGTLLSGIFVFQTPEIPAWAAEKYKVTSSLREMLPILGWAGGGFASQCWYTYWILGAGYGMAKLGAQGKAAQESLLKEMSVEDAKRVKGWLRMVRGDTLMASLIGVVVIIGFVASGAGVLHPKEILPAGAAVALNCAEIFNFMFGKVGRYLFLLGAFAALFSTEIAAFTGWPRLLSDCARVLFPRLEKVPWHKQYRIWILFFAFTNMILVYTFHWRPVFLVQNAAILEGAFLIPIQGIFVLVGLHYILPRLISPEARTILRPGILVTVGISLAVLVYAYFSFAKLIMGV